MLNIVHVYFWCTLLIWDRFATCTNRIIGGNTVTIDKYSYQAQLRINDRFICGAALIGLDTLLTAAHCITKQGQYSVRAGTSFLFNGAESQTPNIKNVKNAILHPSYSQLRTDYDLAILKLDTPFQESQYIKPVALPATNELPKPGKIAVVTGWGNTILHGALSNTLQAVNLPVLSRSVCLDAYRPLFLGISPRMFCAGFLTGTKDACQGDSGGPLVIDGVLHGIVSWGVNCAEPGYPGVYTKIAALRQYIKINTGI